MTTDTLWTERPGHNDCDIGSIVLTIHATSDDPAEVYEWAGSTDLPYSTIAEAASELCVSGGRRGALDLIIDDETSRRIATIERTGGWRVGS